jgi:hypothetical protein
MLAEKERFFLSEIFGRIGTVPCQEGRLNLSFSEILPLSLVRRWYLPWATFLLAVGGLPGPRLPFSTGRWVLFGALALLGFLLLRPQLPALKRRWLLSLTLVAVAFLAHQVWKVGWGLQIAAADRMAFWLVFLLSWQGFRVNELQWRDFFWPLGLALLVVSGWGHFQLLQFVQDSSLTDHYVAVSSLYGYSNNAGQFTALALALFFFLPRSPLQWAQSFRWLVIFSSLLFLGATLNRSAWLALAFGIAVGLSFHYVRAEGLKNLKEKLLEAFRGQRAVILGSVLSLMIVAGGFFVFGQDLAKAWSEKPQLSSWRLQIWKEAGQLLRDNPMGVGAGNYTFSVVPYRKGQTQSETHVTHNPHNEWIRYIVEDGPVLASVLFLFWLLLLVAWWKNRGSEAALVLVFFSVLAVEFTVQFPVFNPMGSWFLAVMGGALLARVLAPAALSPLGPRAFLVFKLLVIVGATAVYVPSSFARLHERSSDISRAKLACEWVPSNFEVCLWAAEGLMQEQKYGEARSLLKMVLEKQPHNWLAIRALAVVGWRDRDRLEACYYMWRYLQYFSDQNSDLRLTMGKQCPKRWINYFDRKRPDKYLGGFKEGKEKAKERMWENSSKSNP